MQGDEVKRYCGQCRLHVHDTSNMSREQVVGLLEETGGRCCLRIWRRPDGRVITRDCNRIRRAIARRLQWIRTAAAGLFAIVGLGSCAQDHSLTGVVAWPGPKPLSTPSTMGKPAPSPAPAEKPPAPGEGVR